MSSTVRGIVMRALFEPDFHNLLVTKPDQALAGYDLTQEESQALKNPSPDLYKFLRPGTDVIAQLRPNSPFEDDGGTPPPPPVTVVVIVVVAIVVFVAATANPATANVAKRYTPLISAIQKSQGADRADLVKTLINEITKGQ